MTQSFFHLATHVSDLAKTRAFYGDLLGGKEGRSAETWVDFDLFGHQLSFHLGPVTPSARTGKVGDHLVPMPHFGIILGYEDWQGLADRLTAAQVEWVIEPSIRFQGQPGEQYTMFLYDPSGNAIELKGFKDLATVFDG